MIRPRAMTIKARVAMLLVVGMTAFVGTTVYQAIGQRGVMMDTRSGRRFG